MGKKATHPGPCAKCGLNGRDLVSCASGWICDTCLDEYRHGRDDTTRVVQRTRIVSLDRPPIVTSEEVTIPRSELEVPRTPPKRPLAASPDVVVRDAANHRHELLGQLGVEATALALDAEIGMDPKNPVEQMLLHQMAVAHKASMDAASKSFLAADPVDQTRFMNISARMMEAFQRAALTLQRLRSGGNQKIVVQHVNVGQGGQAAIGNITTGGGP